MVGVAGGEVILRCHASGYPTPNITWLKDGSDVEGVEEMGPAINVVIFNYTNDFIAFSELHLMGLIISDAGSYTCVAVNFLASHLTIKSSSATLTVLCKHSILYM